jgi:hypothetical protein
MHYNTYMKTTKEDNYSNTNLMLSSDLILAIKQFAEMRNMSIEEAAIYLLDHALSLLDSEEQTGAKTPPPD